MTYVRILVNETPDQLHTRIHAQRTALTPETTIPKASVPMAAAAYSKK